MSFSRVGEDVLPRISCGLGGVWGMGLGYGNDGIGYGKNRVGLLNGVVVFA